MSTLLSVINELGGWPVLQPNWTNKNFDWIESIRIMRKHGFKHHFFLRIRVIPNIRYNTNHSIYVRAVFKKIELIYLIISLCIQLTQPAFGALDSKQLKEVNSSDLNAYYKLMVDVAKAFGANNETAHQDMKDVLKFERKIAKVIKKEKQMKIFSERKCLVARR